MKNIKDFVISTIGKSEKFACDHPAAAVLLVLVVGVISLGEKAIDSGTGAELSGDADLHNMKGSFNFKIMNNPVISEKYNGTNDLDDDNSAEVDFTKDSNNNTNE